ncbi:MAG: hypothetical protein CMM96_01875 [Rickettsiales bacterium]|nr:hypothetical protein [Rickettsiales bacterium]
MELFYNIYFPIILVFFTGISIKLFIIILNYFKIFDIPNKRSNHILPTPKGVGLILSIYIFGSVILFITYGKIHNELLKEIVLMMLALSIFSFFDDLYSISFLKKLFFQTFIVFLSIYFLDSKINEFCYTIYNKQIWRINFDSFQILVQVFIFLFWMWVINLFNFMDGIDGMTATQVITFCIGMIFLATQKQIDEDFSYLGIIIFSVFLSFFYYNKPPAKIFLGDSGSTSIGFLIAYIIILTILEQKNFVSLIILILYHLSDTTYTLTKRIIKKKNIFSAHSEHFYQQKIRKGYSHANVLNKIFSINLLLALFSLIYFKSPILSIILSILMVIYLLKWLGNQKKKINANK